MESDFATWLQAELDRRGWKPTDLARESGLADSTISRVLSGTRRPGRSTLRGIAKALKVSDTVVLYKAGYAARDPDDPTQKLDPIALDILQMLANKTDAQKRAALAALQALFEGLDRGLDGQNTGSRGRSAARKNQD